SLSGYSRLLSFDGGVFDCGLYLLNNVMTFYCGNGGNGNVTFPANGYGDVVVTRSSDGTVKGYINGQLAANYVDAPQYALLNLDNLRCFRDNECAQGACHEDSSGTVSRIRLYDDALTADEVTALETPQDTTTTTLDPLCGDANISGSITAADA